MSKRKVTFRWCSFCFNSFGAATDCWIYHKAINHLEIACWLMLCFCFSNFVWRSSTACLIIPTLFYLIRTCISWIKNRIQNEQHKFFVCVICFFFIQFIHRINEKSRYSILIYCFFNWLFIDSDVLLSV